MKKISLFVLLLAAPAFAQFSWYGWKKNQTSVAGGTVDSTAIVDGGINAADLRNSIVDSTKIVDSGINKADLRVSIIDSSRVSNSGLINADLRVSTLDSSRIVDSGITTADIRTSAITAAKILADAIGNSELAADAVDSSNAVNGSLINADIRVSTLDSTRIIANGIAPSDIRTAAVGATQLAPTAVTAGAYTSPAFTVDGDGRLTAASVVYPPVIFAVDSASASSADTTWIWQNWRGVNVIVDSIIVHASSDDYAISIVERRPFGGGTTLVDAVTASTNGVNNFWQKETTITAATIESNNWIGFKRPASTGDIVNVRIHYH